ncbi:MULTISPECIES: hypothetical protein [unclassified Pseudonocardia]|uniref:hypothetical protein n=1 Tax=unclassified Pseudonocardia TaxID=2619320 RepID=UPI001438A5DF|nr:MULTISPECIES: hypothetical protein [unclassified Pseudonocardia]
MSELGVRWRIHEEPTLEADEVVGLARIGTERCGACPVAAGVPGDAILAVEFEVVR